MKTRVTIALVCAALLGTGCAVGGFGAASASGIDRSAAEPAVPAQDDFYDHVNARWLKTTKMPADKVYVGSWQAIHDTVQDQLRVRVESAAKSRATADERRIGDLYESFIDEAAIDACRRRASSPRRSGG